MDKQTIAIAGGGIGGLTAALALAEKGFAVSVFEQSTEFFEIGAGIQLSPNASRVLIHLGLEQALQEVAFLPTATQFRGWKFGEVIDESPLGDAAVAAYGAPYLHVHRGDLLSVLLAAVQANDKIELRVGAAINSFTQTSDAVWLNNDEEAYAVLIGADGIHSKVRQALWGKSKPHFTDNIAWRALVPAADLPTGLIKPMSTVWWGPGRHFVHYYVRRGELVNCVCVAEQTGWEVESWTEPGELSELRQAFSGWHRDLQTLIDHVEPASLYKWALFDRAPMAAWGKNRVTLLGDACHPTLPFMAQGAAMAIEDAAVLAATLAATSSTSEALSQYEALRKSRTAMIQNGSRRNATVFHLSGVPAWMRNRATKFAGKRTVDKLYEYDALNVV